MLMAPAIMWRERVNLQNNNVYIIILLYRNGIFLQNPYSHFTEARGSAEHHLRNTAMIESEGSPPFVKSLDHI
jgi:hypothetical protein